MTDLLQVRDLRKLFPVRGLFRTLGYVHAVDGVDFSIARGETVGLVGESGCGKTTVGRAILRLIEPTSGQIWFDGQNILDIDEKGMRSLRRNMQIVFQDPFNSLDPRLTIRDIIGDVLKLHHLASGDKIDSSVVDLLNEVRLQQAQMYRFSHEFSGGEKQRVAIARALAAKPDFIVLDEPTSSLDVSVQANILNLLRDLQDEKNLAYLFISHDMSVVEHMSNRIYVMYLGKVVEAAGKEELFLHPEHPYTQALLSAIPIPDPERTKKRIILAGEVPSPVNPPSGCRFGSRCPYSRARCFEEEPMLTSIRDQHSVACHFAGQLERQS